MSSMSAAARAVVKNSTSGAINLQITSRSIRTLAYPTYTSLDDVPTSKRRKTVPRRLLEEFLGPKNYKGEYKFSKYAYPNYNHTTNYINPADEGRSHIPAFAKAKKGRHVPLGNDANKNMNGEDAEMAAEERDGEDDLAGGDDARTRDPLQPFPNNPALKTNVMISRQMKQDIVSDVTEGKMSLVEIADKYKLKVERIQAIVKLATIEKDWIQKDKITPSLKKMADTLYLMFPLYNPAEHGENITEIPVPSQAANSRFVSIAESEPFGPIDAAKELGIEPAATTLSKILKGDSSNIKETAENDAESIVVLAKQNSKISYKFTDSKVGRVGYRYGRSLRDTRKDREIGYDANGRRYYKL